MQVTLQAFSAVCLPWCDQGKAIRSGMDADVCNMWDRVTQSDKLVSMSSSVHL